MTGEDYQKLLECANIKQPSVQHDIQKDRPYTPLNHQNVIERDTKHLQTKNDLSDRWKDKVILVRYLNALIQDNIDKATSISFIQNRCT